MIHAALLLTASLFADAFDEKGSLTSYKHPVYLHVRSGWHFMKESPSMVSGRTQLVDSHMLFKGESAYSSATEIAASSQNLSAPVLNLEVVTGIPFNKLPLFSNIRFLSENRNFFAGAGISYYPKIARDTRVYSGAIEYRNTVTAQSSLQTMNYETNLSLEENFFSLVPEVSLYYMLPMLGRDSARSAFFARFYVGVTGGLGMLSGKRKMTLSSGDLVVNAQTYNVQASFQDTLIDGLGFKGALSAGAMIHLKDAHFIDIRFSYVFHETSAVFTRSGFWNETERDAAGNLGYTVARRNINEDVRYNFSQSGILLTLGYTARIK